MTLDELFLQLAPKIAQAFREAIAAITDNVVLKQVVEAVERNDVDAAFKAIDFDPSVFNRFYFSLTDVFQVGGDATLAKQPKRIEDADGVKMNLRFNVRDKRAEEWLMTESSRLITNVEGDMRQAIASTMTDGLRAGRNPRSVALDIVGRINTDTRKREGGVLGLNADQEEWSRNVRIKLNGLDDSYFENKLRDGRFDSVVRRAIDTGKPLDAATVDKLVDRYRARALRYRGEQIARTETLAALHRSEWLSIKQSIEKGRLSVAQVQKVWDSTGDARVRPSHVALNGQTVGFDEPFVSPLTGSRMMHPGDATLGASGEDIISCRCGVRYKVDWFNGL